MKIKQSILDKIDNPISRVNIAQELGCGEQAVIVQIKNNNDNGRLTKMDALMAISKETGVEVNGILEEDKVSVVGGQNQ